MPGLPNWIARAFGALSRKDATHTIARPPASGPPTPRPAPSRVGHYRVDRTLGQGGMGVVYAAYDERLDRPVALKMIGVLAPDEQARRRFTREAKAAARINHPHVCQIYEVGEDSGEPFIAMELLAGETMAQRLASGALPLPDTVTAGLQMLDALDALHAQGLVHRDLKPSNVFLGPRGVKLLDFGLARAVDSSLVEGVTHSQLTRSGALVGTPHYMSPEQVYGSEVDARSDVFAAGAILFEMLAGRPAFPGRTVVEVLYATLHEQPPALTGSPAVVALDRVVRRALAKDPQDRHASAAAMAEELRAVSLEGATVARAAALTRLIVLPFRILRPDPETDFLAFSLADAITSSLTGRDPLVVRSSLVAQRFALGEPDLKRLAAEADVDRVITGTLLRSGDQLRVGAQLLDVPAGTVLWSHTAQAAAGDVFGVQDDLVSRVVSSLAPSAGEAPRQDKPVSARAYEFYLRANQLAQDYQQLAVARDLYRECLQEDPGFAPAWARVGRCYRVIGKFVEDTQANTDRAEEAFRRALSLNPDLSVAHKLYAHLEAELGRGREAMVRLLGRARVTRHDPEIFAALVHACRYGGLLEESLAAHEEARRLDPGASTSVAYTLWVRGDYRPLIDAGVDTMDHHPQALALAHEGHIDEARSVVGRIRQRFGLPSLQVVLDHFDAVLDDRREDAAALSERVIAGVQDPEAWLVQACSLAHVGQPGRALELLEQVVERGYYGISELSRNPWCASIRDRSEFARILAKAAARREEVRGAFVEAGGDELLGIEARPRARAS
jgi:eukaryotic-like serine/threonine-protein kinase